MPSYQAFPIADYATGLYDAKELWLSPQDAFEVLENVYINRGRLLKRKGSVVFSRLETTATTETDSGDGTTGPYTGTLGNLPVAPGSITITDQAVSANPVVTDTDDADGTGTLAGAGGSTGTINYITGVYSVTFGALVTSGSDNIDLDYSHFRGSAVMKIIRRFTAAGTEELIALDPDRIFVYQSGSGRFTDQLTSDIFTGDSSNYYWVENFNGNPTFLAITNNVDVPKKWNGSTLASMGVTNTGGLTRARIIIKYKGRLCYINTLESGNALPGRLRFSAVNAFETFTSTDWVEPDTSGEAVSAAILNDVLYVFFDNPPGVYKVLHTGNPLAPFVYRQVDSSLGSAATHSTVTRSGRILTLGPTEFTVTDGSSTEKANTLNPRFVQRSMSQAALAMSNSILANELEQAWISYVSAGGVATEPDNVAVFDIDSGAMTVFDLIYHTYGQFTNATSLTWADFDGTSGILVDSDAVFGDDTWGAGTEYTWNEPSGEAGFPIILGGTRSGYVRKLNVGTSDTQDAASGATPATNPITSLLRTIRLNPFKGDYEQVRMGSFDIIATRDAAVTLTIRLYAGYETTPHTTTTVTLDGDDQKVIKPVIVNRTAEFHQIEIENTSTSDVAIDAIVPHFAPVGALRKVA